MKNISLKVCGLTRPSDFTLLQKMGVDYGGIIFYPKSPRYAVGKLNPEAVRNNKGIQKVGVFVNEDQEEIQSKIKEFGLDAVQLHGNESVELCQALKFETTVIKAFRVKEKSDLELAKDYEGSCDYFLFDTAGKDYGGNGILFNWEILKDYSLTTPFFLSGGIGLEQVEALQKLNLPKLAAIDVNSKFEIEPGIKDLNLIQEFICNLTTY